MGGLTTKLHCKWRMALGRLFDNIAKNTNKKSERSEHFDHHKWMQWEYMQKMSGGWEQMLQSVHVCLNINVSWTKLSIAKWLDNSRRLKNVVQGSCSSQRGLFFQQLPNQHASLNYKFWKASLQKGFPESYTIDSKTEGSRNRIITK